MRINISLFVLLFHLLLCSKVVSSRPSSSRKWSGSSTNIDHIQETDRPYAALPTTFAPNGRIYNVEQKAKQASDSKDVSSSLVIAISFGNNNILVLSTQSMSPHVYRSSVRDSPATTTKGATTATTATKKPRKSLWTNDFNYPVVLKMPLTVISSNIILGTGGRAADSIQLHRRICEAALQLHYSNTVIMNDNDEMNGFSSGLMARKIADMVQGATQSMTTQIFASGAIIMGGNDLLDSKNTQPPIWRIDPTGQFFNCHAAAVGRGAGNAEATILEHVAKYKRQLESERSNLDNDEDIQSLLTTLTNNEVKSCLQTLSFEDATVLACRCCAQALKLSFTADDDNDDDDLMVMLNDIGIQGVLIRPRTNDEPTQKVIHELVHPVILREAMRLALLG